MTRDDAEEYTQALGQVLGGSWRQVALGKRLGVPDALGLSVDQWVRERLGGYVKLSIDERRAAVAELREQGLTQRDVADVLGVGVGTVARDDAPNGASHENTIGQTVAHAPNGATDDEHDEPRGNVHFSSETAEHYTPKDLLAIVVECLGAIDLDPCSNGHTDPNVPAAAHFTRDDDGLSREWHGRVYMNPPYGREIDRWITKLLAEVESGRVTEAIALVPARTDTQWFERLRDHVCCFIRGRLEFVGNNDPAPFPSALFYLGEHIDKFYYSVSELGDVWQRIEPGMFGE